MAATDELGHSAAVVCKLDGFVSDRSDDDNNKGEDCPFGDPFLEDGFGNLTRWRLSDLKKEYIMHLESESSKPKTQEKKYSKQERLKLYDYRMEQYMKAALKKYNNDENLDEDLCFEFVESRKESSIVEGDKFYQHFNFVAKQARSTTVLFFTEVIPDGGRRCLGCMNQGDPELRHPASDNVYVGGHEDCMWPFLSGSDSDSENEQSAFDQPCTDPWITITSTKSTLTFGSLADPDRASPQLQRPSPLLWRFGVKSSLAQDLCRLLHILR
ncbi:hypothetical protein EJB05_23557, partial [Eragrostis curvula]